MRCLLALVLTVGLLVPGGLRAQQGGTAEDVMSGIRAGGGWVGIPIRNGHGSFSTVRVPTLGLTIGGCLVVAPQHSGRWEITARENVMDTALSVAAEPGVGVTFEHTFGLQAQIDFDFRWSESADTTLMLWVGVRLDTTRAEEACTPVYGEPG